MNSPKLPPLTAAEIAELRRLEAAATPGEWEVEEEKGGISTTFRWIKQSTPFNRFGGKHVVVGSAAYISNRHGEVYGPSMREIDAELITALRNAAPRLLAAAEREQKLREAIVAAIDGLESGMFHFKQSGLDTEGRYAMNSIANALANLKIRYAKISEVQK